MGRKYTEAQKRASINYQKSKSQIKITVDQSMRDRYQEHAKKKGTTLTQLIIALLEKDITDSEEQ